MDRFGLEEGLPGLFVTDLAVTSDGRLWSIASGRLTAFDGRVFEAHGLDRTVVRPGEPIIGIGPATGDTLWVAVGTAVVSYAHGRTTLRATHDRRVRDVWQDSSGGLWAWDDDGPLQVGEGTVERVIEAPSITPPVVRIDPAGDPTVLHLQDPGGGKLRRFGPPVVAAHPPRTWPVPGVTQRGLTSRHGADGGVVVERVAGGPGFVLPGGSARTPMLIDSQGRLWSNEGHRVEVWSSRPGGSASALLADFVLPDDARVHVAAEDPEGNLWLGTMTDGLFRVRERPVRVLGAGAGLTDDQVRTVGNGAGGSVLVVDDFGNLWRYSDIDVDTLFEAGTAAGRVLAAITDRAGVTWYSHLRDSEATLVGLRPDGSERRIRLDAIWPLVVKEDPGQDGLLWLAGGTVYRLDTTVDDPLPDGPLLPRGWRVRDVWPDGDGSAWAVGAAGLARVTPEGIATLGEDAAPPLGSGRALHRTADGTLWIGRYDGGLLVHRDERFHEITPEDGLWDAGVSSILEDDRGTLWMASNRGVHRVDIAEVYDFLDGRIDEVRGRGYGPDAGFLNAETSGWPATRTDDGRLWFPTFGGVAVIDPTAVREREERAPRVRIRQAVAGDSILPTDTVAELPPGLRRLDIAYAATLLAGQERVRYEVRLDGVDDAWVDTGPARQVSYGSLPPGNHVFRVRAFSGAGVGSRAEASLAVVVPPRFTETNGFRLLLVLMASGVLAGLFQVRVRQLRAREVALQALVDSRTRDLAASKQATEAALVTVEAQARDLRSLDEAKSRFFANVSHELRTPLTLVQGPLQDVLDGRLGPTPEPVRRQVETVLASGRRLGDLIEQLLDVARIESGAFELDRRRQDVHPLLERIEIAFAALARARNIRWAGTLPPRPLEATLDADRFEKVVSNLLANALKFTPAGGAVRFEVGVSERTLCVTVADTGPGIPEWALEQVFERFRQVDDSPRRSHEGAGLGLSLVKEIVEMHGGTVSVASTVDVGSTFTVRLPLDGRIGSGSPDPAGDTWRTRPSPSSPVEASSEAPARSDEPDTDRPTILVVEDHAELRAYVRRHLEDDYRVVEARDGREGLEAARTEVPDLILCDIMMPEMDGERLCRAIRSDPEVSFLPVVMVTARASRPARLSALEGGADDYLVKPFDPEELRLRIRNLFDARRRLASRLRDRGESLPFVDLTGSTATEHQDFVRRLGEVLRERAGDDDFGVDDLARALFMSRASLYRVVGEALDTSPMEVVWTYRLEQAAHWFRHTDASVGEVAYACGFKTVPHFTRRFKAHHGVTPAAYRSDARG